VQPCQKALDWISEIWDFLAAVVCYCFIKVSSNSEAFQQLFYETANYCYGLGKAKEAAKMTNADDGDGD
jgi:hypothetical protein